MPSKLIIQGRTYYSRGYKKHPQPVVARGRDGEPLDCVTPLANQNGKVDRKLRAGDHYTDPDDQVVYSVLRNLPPAEGWASLDFWLDHLRLPHKPFIRLVKHGWFNAAMEDGSEVRRYRCRDEVSMKKSKQWHAAREAARMAEKKAREKAQAEACGGYKGYLKLAARNEW